VEAASILSIFVHFIPELHSASAADTWQHGWWWETRNRKQRMSARLITKT